MRISIDNFKGCAVDVGLGKQPQGTLADADDVVRDKQAGSLAMRYGYKAVLTTPSGLTTLEAMLTLPVTYPTSEEVHAWFGQDVGAAKHVWMNPYWHNSATKTTGWIDLAEKVLMTLVSIPTVAGTPTNTITMTGSDTAAALGLSATANYYKNWFFFHLNSGGGPSYWLVTAYSVSGGYPIFTLDSVIDGDTSATITGAHVQSGDVNGLYRYFHSDQTFVPSYTDPAGYSTEIGVRISGGQGSTAGYKNIFYGYKNTTFFKSSGTPYTFTGSYADQAECKAPASGLLKASNFTSSDANANLIKSSSNYDFDSTTDPNWAVTGTVHTVGRVLVGIKGGIGSYAQDFGLQIQSPSNVDGAAGTEYVGLGSTYVNALAAVSHTLKIWGYAPFNYHVEFKVRVKDGGTTYDSPIMLLWNRDNDIHPVDFTFTSTTTGAPEIQIFLVGMAGGQFSNTLVITGISLGPTLGLGYEVPSGKTYKLYTSAVYDGGSQELELTYLATKYLTGKFSKLSYTLTVGLGTLNKRISGYRLYISLEDGDTTSAASSTTQARMLVADIPIDDNSSASWAFNVATGKYEYAGAISGLDLQSINSVSWEQKTNRTVSASTTCSYSLAKSVAGRIFLGQDYDYADGKAYYNRVRYTGYNGDGAPTPDIFPNIQDVFITTVTAGNNQNIKNLVEFRGNLFILKAGSIVALTTSQPDPSLWQLETISASRGCINKFMALKTDYGLIFGDAFGLYRYNGGMVEDISLGIWKYLYASKVGTTSRMWLIPRDQTLGLRLEPTDSAHQHYVVYLQDNLFVTHNLYHRLTFHSTLSDGTVYWATTTGLAYSFDTSIADAGETFYPTMDTGWIFPDATGWLSLRKVFVGINYSTNPTGTFKCSLFLDGSGSAFQSWNTTMPPSNCVLELPVAPNKCKYFKLTVNSNSGGATEMTAGSLSFQSLAFDLDQEPAQGDVKRY